MNTFRDPAKNEIIELWQENKIGKRLVLPRNNKNPLDGQWDPETGDVSVAPTGKHAPVGLRVQRIYDVAAEAAGIKLT
jgi:hypothetical protein